MVRVARILTVGAVAAAATLTALVTPAANAATPTFLRAAVVITATAPVDTTDAVIVRASRVTKTTPVTVVWGNGSSTRIVTGCGATIAKRTPARCAGTAVNRYTKPGTYLLQVKQRGVTVARQQITVTTPGSGSTPTPTPTPTATPTATPTPTPTPSSSPTPTATPTPTVTSAPPAASGWETDMLAQVNKVRASVGAAPLTLCSALTRSAQLHAEDMANRNYFSHYTPEGVGPGTRINAQGYRGGWGENIAAGYSDVNTVMDGWINSPGHYSNMITASHTHVGFGKAENSGSSYGTYWVQNFGSGGTC